MKKIIRYTLWILGGLIIALLLLPFVFKDKFIDAAKEKMEAYINADIEFNEVHLSVFKDFPLINLGFQNLQLHGIETFDSIQLLNAGLFELTTDWKSMIRPNQGIVIHEIIVKDAQLDLLVNEAGLRNYDIWKTTGNAKEESISGNINAYSLMNCTLNYTDETSKTKLNINGLDHQGKGNFDDIIFDLSTVTNIEEFTIAYNDINYLYKAKLNGVADILVDLDKNMYTIGDNSINLNNLAFSLTGVITLGPEFYDLNLALNAPGNQVADVISIIPHIYSEAYNNIESSGIGSIEGIVKGQYNSTRGIFPAIKVEGIISEGKMSSEKEDAKLENINLKASVIASEGNWSDMVIDMPAFAFSVDNKPMNGTLLLTQLFGNTGYDLSMIGETDLETLKDFLQLDQFRSLTGMIKSDISFQGKKSDIEDKLYENLRLAGDFSMNDFEMVDEEDQTISIDKVNASFSPEMLKALFSDAKYSGSDFSGAFELRDPLNLIFSNSKPYISLNANSRLLNLNALTQQNDNPGDQVNDEIIIPVDFDINYKADKILYEDYDLQNLELNIGTKQNHLIVDPSSISMDESNISFKGELDNYYMGEQGLSGKVVIDADKINFNKYLDESSGEASTSVIQIPEDINLEIHSEVNNIQYNQLTLNNTSASIEIREGLASLTDGHTRLFKGNVAFDGSYDPREKDNPLFNFRYNMSDLKFEEMFQHSGTFKALAPIAEYIDGIFNSTLVISGPLGEDLLPDLYNISASGYMETVQGKIKGFRPLEMLAASIGVDKLKEWDIRDSKNWFEVTDGVVHIKEHDYKVEDMSFKVAGSHALDQNIDYTIKAIIPRERLEKGKVGAELDSSLDRIEKEAKSRGVEIDLGDNIYFDIYITGNIKSPKVSIIPTGSGGESIDELVRDEIRTRVDELKDETAEKLESKTEEIKDTIGKAAKEKMDSLQSKADKKLDSMKQVIKDKVVKDAKTKIDSSQQKAIDSLSKKVGKEVEDIFGKKAQGEIDSIKSKIKDWNPFKKKKKEGN
ncbi:MAG: hypothetical protein HKN67_00910 [Saprospiraceae bacterium]|nr:hypothetical protein [Saprospiraceae bacterium]